ncbi:MAG: hypothetical protein ACYSTY_14895 [Planctomycetota bacterium]
MTVCCNRGPVGNIQESALKEIWDGRPRFWESGCCQIEGSANTVSEIETASLAAS